MSVCVGVPSSLVASPQMYLSGEGDPIQTPCRPCTKTTIFDSSTSGEYVIDPRIGIASVPPIESGRLISVVPASYSILETLYGPSASGSGTVAAWAAGATAKAATSAPASARSRRHVLNEPSPL